MATDLRNLPANFDTDATFRTWGTGIAAQLVACGLVKTSDTGQIDWTTVAKPGAFNTSMGFEIYRFADTLQATVPVYIKIQYGSGNGAANGPGLVIAVGTATNGAGTLTGTVISDRNSRQTGSPPAAGTTYPSYCCGSASDGRILLFNDVASTATTIGFSIERVRDGAGAVNADGVAITTVGFSGAVQYQILPATGPAPAALAGLPLLTDTGALKTYGVNAAMYPLIYYVGRLYWGLNMLGYTSGMFTSLTPISVTHLGAAHTYLPTGLGYITTPAILWE